MLRSIKFIYEVTKRKMKDIIVKCFQTLNNYYFYDRCSNSIVKVNHSEYEILKKIEETGVIPQNVDVLNRFYEEGLLNKRITCEVNNHLDYDMEYSMSNNIGELILQVTQQCNLRCAYCAYSGNYYNREHSDKRMTFETAKQAIDFYLTHTNDTDQLTIAFYGGEPLLEFSLIEKCVEYTNKKAEDKNIRYFITTNGTLLTDKTIPFLVKHNFVVTISLDGNKEEHDINRKFRDGRGSFDLIISNLRRLKKYDEEFFSNVRYNTVINPKANLKEVIDYFLNDDLIDPMNIHISSLAQAGLKNPSLLETDENFWLPDAYEKLKILLFLLNKIKSNAITPFYRGQIDEFVTFYKTLQNKTPELEVMQHGGPCIPGARRLFVDTIGRMYPCERVNELSPDMNIGDVEHGFNFEHAHAIYNIGKITEKYCLDCWNLRLCRMCAGSIDSDPETNRITPYNKLCKCEKSKMEILSKLRRICTLVEMGYKYQEESEDE